MNDFVDAPLKKKQNRQNMMSRLDRLEAKTGARPSLSVDSLAEISGSSGDALVVDELIVPAPETEVTEPTDTAFTGHFVKGAGATFNSVLYQIGGVAAGVLGWGGTTAGKLLAGVGAVVLDALGISLNTASSYSAPAALKFVTGGSERSRIYNIEGGGVNDAYLDVLSVAATDSALRINVDAPTGKASLISLIATSVTPTSALTVGDTGITLDVSLSSSNMVAITGSLEVSNVRAPGSVVLQDDTVLSFAPALGTGVILVSTNPANDYVWTFYNTAGAIAAGPISANTVVGTGVLTDGTSDGVDGKLNVHVHTDGNIYIKNRRGAARGIYFTLM
jgi:hypothetical protein